MRASADSEVMGGELSSGGGDATDVKVDAVSSLFVIIVYDSHECVRED